MATLLQLKCELTAEKEAFTTKTVQITNYIKAKSTLRHIYMIQMCVYNSILAGRLGDCWLAPGKAGWPLGRLAATAGCTGRLLAGPWKGWLAPGKAAGCAELLIFADFADLCCYCLVVEAQG